MRTNTLAVLLPLLLIGCERGDQDTPDQPAPPDPMVGISQAQVLKDFGEPSRKQTIIRPDGPDAGLGFGPPYECQYFLDLPDGTAVDIWYYNLKPDEGWLREFHFVQGTDAVVFHQFLDEMVCY